MNNSVQLPVMCYLSINHNNHNTLPTDLCYGESGDDITFTSEAFAKHLTDTDSFEHSSEETSGNFAGSFGENLATKSKCIENLIPKNFRYLEDIIGQRAGMRTASSTTYTFYRC